MNTYHRETESGVMCSEGRGESGPLTPPAWAPLPWRVVYEQLVGGRRAFVVFGNGLPLPAIRDEEMLAELDEFMTAAVNRLESK